MYAYQCEVCKKEDREGKGWAHLEARSSGYCGCSGIANALSQQSRPSSTLNLSGVRSLQTNHTIDLCSPECAGKWVFGS